MVTITSRTGNRERLRFALKLATLLAAVTLLTVGSAAGDCVTIEVDAPLRLPDGSVHPSGSLTLCHSIRYSPISSLHETYVNGSPLGMLRSRARTSEVGNDAPAVVYFNRSSDGYLDLYGYVVPQRDSSVTFLFEPRQARGTAKAKRNRDPVTSPSKVQADLVAVAAPSP